MKRLPPLNALRAFEAAGRHLSFSKAAEELHVTPAAVSHHIKSLEEHLGVALFRREPRRLLLTDAGQRALPGVRDGFERLAGALAEIQESADDEVLTVSVVPSFASKWLVPRLDRFRDRAPDLDIRLDATGHLVDFARETDIDVGVRYGRGEFPDLHVEKLLEGGLVPVCSPRLMDDPERPLRTPDDLRHHTLLHTTWQRQGATDPDWEMWLQCAGVDGIDATRGPRFNHSEYSLQAAVEGHGVALASQVLVADDVAAGRLVQPFGGCMSGDTPFAYYLVAPPQKAKLKRVRAFREWLLAELDRSRAGEPTPETEREDA